MSSLEHECLSCGFIWSTGNGRACPKCKSWNTRTECDEAADYAPAFFAAEPADVADEEGDEG